MNRLADWIEERTGYRAFLRAALDEEVPGGARGRYVFGSVLVFLLLNQSLTGVLLAMGYAPSVSDAWASVAYTQEVVPLGWFIRGLHSAGASAAICVIVLHLMQVTWAGAYRRPREVTWWVGLGLLGLLLAFGLTGYLLPWDQKGYFATQVATNLLGATPVVGAWVQELVQGGREYGNLTLTRFYAVHVLVLPALTVVVLGLHIALFRRHGVTPPATLDARALARRTTFYPAQVAIDLGAAALCLGLLLVSVLRSHGASLEAPADPASVYEARPEWYFLPLFQLLRQLPGSLELVGAMGAPLVVGGLLFALPFLDRSPERRASSRKLPIGIVAFLLLAGLGLGVSARLEDEGDQAYLRGRARAEREARSARLRFRGRIDGASLGPAERLALGDALFDEHCASCHVLGGRGEARAPLLDAWSSRAWLDAFLSDPEAPRFFGHTAIRGMKPVTVAGPQRAALIEWLWAQGGEEGSDPALVAAGAVLIEGLGCDECHEQDRSSAGLAPNLGGRASVAWLGSIVRDAGAAHLFGKKSEMPRFEGKLSDLEVDALVGLLRRERMR